MSRGGPESQPHRKAGGQPPAGRLVKVRLTIGVGLVAAVAVALAALPAIVAAAEPAGDVDVGAQGPATANDLHAPAAHNSPELAVDPTDARLVALAYRTDNPEFSCGLALSGDGGRSWIDGAPLAGLPDGVDHCYAPQVAFDADGTLYFLFVGLAGQGNTPQGVWLMTSDDRGRTFARPQQVLGPNNYQVRLAVDRQHGETGRLHLAWLDVAGEPSTGGLPPTHNPIVAAHSDDGGRNWSEPATVSGSQQRRVVAPEIAIGAAGEIHIAYFDLKGDVRDYQGLAGPVWPDPWAVEVATSRDGGQSFADPVVVDDGVQPAGRVTLIFTMPPPALAADADGRVYAGWHDARRSDTADVLVARSTDHGQTWAAPTAIGDAESDQQLPELAVAPDGRLELAFFDQQAAPDDHLQHVGYAASPDHGRTFHPARRLTTQPSDRRTGPRFHLPAAQGHVEVGTGVALHAGADHAVAAWPDTRHAIPGTAHQDLYTTLAGRDATSPPVWWWLAGVAAIAVAAAAGGWWWRRRRRRRQPTPPTISGVVALLAVLALAGCSPGESGDGEGAALPGEPATVEIGMDEYAFDVPDQVPVGRVTLEAHNRGDEPHDLVLVPLPGDADLADLLDAPTPVAVPPTHVISPHEPGDTATVAVDLEPGRYGLVCFVEDADGTPHHLHGMHAQFTVSR